MNGKGFNVTLVVNNSNEAPVIATPATSITLPAMPPGQQLSEEYMAAVAVSLQKTKELEEAQHQSAIQKTLTLALEKKEAERQLKEQEDKINALQ